MAELWRLVRQLCGANNAKPKVVYLPWGGQKPRIIQPWEADYHRYK